MLAHVKHERQHSLLPWFWAMLCLGLCMVAAALSPAQAQDVRGMQICTVEKQMERRTSCLQANVEFLQQALLKLNRETQAKFDSEDRALATARTEIAMMQSVIKKLEGELAKLQAKANPAGKK
jgi:hypothetical protein